MSQICKALPNISSLRLVLCRRMPYSVAIKHMHGACAALLYPSAPEPLVWPSPLKFISELNQDAKVLLEQALMEANKEREKSILKGTAILLSPSHSDAGTSSDISEVISFLSLYCSPGTVVMTSFQLNRNLSQELLSFGKISRLRTCEFGNSSIPTPVLMGSIQV